MPPYSFNSSNLSYDPRGNYYYYVPSSDVGSVSQTWTYWYVPDATRTSDSTADAPARNFFVGWSALFLIPLYGVFPEAIFILSMSVSNTVWGVMDDIFHLGVPKFTALLQVDMSKLVGAMVL